MSANRSVTISCDAHTDEGKCKHKVVIETTSFLKAREEAIRLGWKCWISSPSLRSESADPDQCPDHQVIRDGKWAPR